MKSFVYQSLPSRVVFGAGARNSLAHELDRLGVGKALVLCTPQQTELAEAVAQQLGERGAGIFDQAVMHVPLETAQQARDTAARLGATACVAVGGGSTIGLAKAIALTAGLPIIAIPTTFAGSEMTPIYGITDAGVKKTGRDERVLPKVTIYDPELVLTLPPGLAGPSGMNAIAHAAEALYAQDGNPIIGLMAEESIRSLAQSLPGLIARPGEPALTATALYGAWLAGVCLGTVGMALHHKLCHTLGGAFNLDHARMHAIVLPYSLAYNRKAVPDAMNRIARALGTGDAVVGLYELGRKLGIPAGLKDIGMPADGVARAAELATQNPYFNPRPIERPAIEKLLQAALAGVKPTENEVFA